MLYVLDNAPPQPLITYLLLYLHPMALLLLGFTHFLTPCFKSSTPFRHPPRLSPLRRRHRYMVYRSGSVQLYGR